MQERSALLDRVIKPQLGGFSEEFARQVLAFDFPPADLDRYKALSEKAQDGTLSSEERADLEKYLDVNDFLIAMKAKAKASLRKQNPAA